MMNGVGSNVPSPEQAAELLDFNREFNVPLLESIIGIVFTSSNQAHMEMANNILAQLKEHPNAWVKVDTILENATTDETRLFGLQILDITISSRWKLLPEVQRNAVKNYVVNTIIKISSDPNRNAQKVLITKFNMVLVQILKQEWPHNWPSFIPDIIGSSQKNEYLCLNNMNILRLLSEEVFDFSAGQMTQVKTKQLKDSICGQFSEVFNLCMFVFENSQQKELVLATLDTLLKFLSWIPLGYIFETKLIETLLYKFFPLDEFRNLSLECLTEIGSLKLERNQYNEQFLNLIQLTMQQIKQMVPLAPLADAYKGGSGSVKDFIRALSLFLTGFLKAHIDLLESNTANRELILEMHQYLIYISGVDDTEIFKICLEYWNSLTESLYNESPFTVSTTQQAQNRFMNASSPRRELYATTILTPLRHVMIQKMVKPEEVLVVETDNGELIREFMPLHTDALNMFKTMRETLVYLTHLDFQDTKSIMEQKLVTIVETTWTWHDLNTLCWAIGAISGAMSPVDEKAFIVTVIRYLLGLCEQVVGKSNKAVVASNIMYVVGQYPRFLRAHWKFLKVVVKKLFEFMHESHEGVQDMSCDTFLKIAKKCRRLFVIVQHGEKMAFIDEIIEEMPGIITDLQQQQVGIFYEALGFMITSQSDAHAKEMLIQKLMALPNTHWDNTVQQVAMNSNNLQDINVIKPLSNILQINISACTSIGHPFVTQLQRIFLDIINLYKCLSEFITNGVNASGEQILNTVLFKKMSDLKRDSLKLIKTWIQSSEDFGLVNSVFIPPLFQAVLGDYNNSVPQARLPEVLSLMGTIIDVYGQEAAGSCSVIFEAVFECTIDMINKDLSDYPTHRTNFFALLESMCSRCFEEFFAIPERQFNLVIESIIWAMKHTMRGVAESGLNILYTILENAPRSNFAQRFFQNYFLNLVEQLLGVLTDSSFKHAFKKHASILALMIQLVDTNSITIPLYNDAMGVAPGTSNQVFFQNYLKDLLLRAFPSLQQPQVITIITQLFTHYVDKDLNLFRSVLLDFLVQIKVYGDDVDIQAYTQDAQETMKVAQSKLNIPGMANPNTANEEDFE